VHAVMLKQLPIAHPQALYRVGEGNITAASGAGWEGSWGTFDYPFYKHLRDTNSSFEQIAAFSGNTPSLNVRRANSAAGAQATNGEYVSGNYFSTLGLQPALGRLLNPSDDRAGASAAAVMGYSTWQQSYGADPSIVGSTLLVNGLPVTLVGIAPEGFFRRSLHNVPARLVGSAEPGTSVRGAGSEVPSGYLWRRVAVCHRTTQTWLSHQRRCSRRFRLTCSTGCVLRAAR